MPKRKKRWSYKAGEWGRNRVLAFQDPRDGKFWLQWREHQKRCTLLLEGVTTQAEAKIRADSLAAKFAEIEEETEAPVTLTRLLVLYTKEVTPAKGISKQKHDRRAVRVFRTFFEAQPETSRRSTRHPKTLDRTDWDRFIQWRREGRVPGWETHCRDRQVQADLKFMIAVLNWATGHKLNGRPVLETSPWRTELRRAQRWGMPKELNPHRPGITDEMREKLIAHAPSWQFGLALVLERETRRRNNAIRQLRWSDVDLEEETVIWRGETDKAGRAGVTPLSEVAVAVLRGAPSRGIGEAPVFPSATDPSKPTPRDTFQIWLQRSKARWLKTKPETQRLALKEQLRGVGFHAEKRSGVRDPRFRALPPAIQEAIAGTSFSTLKDTYDEVTVEDIREAQETLNKAFKGAIGQQEWQAGGVERG